MPVNLKRAVFDQCVPRAFIYGCDTYRIYETKLKTTQWATERADLTRRDRKRAENERQQKFWTSYRETKTLQWQWARHVSRKTNTVLEWSQRELTRTRGRLPDRWEKEIMIDRFNWRVQRKAEYNSSEIIMYNINSRVTSL